MFLKGEMLVFEFARRQTGFLVVLQLCWGWHAFICHDPRLYTGREYL